jgi:hypothetical protein
VIILELHLGIEAPRLGNMQSCAWKRYANLGCAIILVV